MSNKQKVLNNRQVYIYIYITYTSGEKRMYI